MTQATVDVSNDLTQYLVDLLHPLLDEKGLVIQVKKHLTDLGIKDSLAQSDLRVQVANPMEADEANALPEPAFGPYSSLPSRPSVQTVFAPGYPRRVGPVGRVGRVDPRLYRETTSERRLRRAPLDITIPTRSNPSL